MQHIIPHLWFDKESKEAAAFYATLFPESRVTNVSAISGTPSGDCDIVSFTLWGLRCMAISAGPYFTKNPSISFMVNFDPSEDVDARNKLDAVWKKLSDGGLVRMPLDTYPFSEHYGWVDDKYGVSWQLILTRPEGEKRPHIIPSLLFVGDVCGKAEEASDFYISLFGGKRGAIARYGKGMEPDKENTLMFTDFALGETWFVAMDSAREHKFGFNEAVSLIVECDTQEEIDRYWGALSATPEAEQCGWLKDKYGVSWQIVPRKMNEMMKGGTPEARERLTKAFLQMKKFDIATLEKAFAG